MTEARSLPLAAGDLPETIRRFGDPGAAGPAKLMAARGLVPVRGDDLVTLLVQLAHDADPPVKDAARATLRGIPEAVLWSACDAELHPAILDGILDAVGERGGVVERLVQNRAVPNHTILRIARAADEHISEIIAVNQERLLGAPEIIEALYHNRHTRMSTVDRLVELAARNNVVLHGVATFQEHVEAIKGQLIPEPSDEALPSDRIFSEALDEDDDDPEAITLEEDGTERLKEKFASLREKIKHMSLSEKVRFAAIGNAAARTILIRDPRRLVHMAAARTLTAKEASEVVRSKEVAYDVIVFVAQQKRFLGTYAIKKALVFNPRTPPTMALRFIAHLMDKDLRDLTRSREVPGPIRTAAVHRWQQKQKSGGRS
jgi:hypothetical protein